MDFTGLLQKILGGGGAAGAPMDIRPPAAGGMPASPMPTAPQGPSIFDRLGAGIQGAARGMNSDSPMGAATQAFTAAHNAGARPSIMPQAGMGTPTGAGPTGPMDIRPPVAGGPAMPATATGPSAGEMGGLIDKLALLLGSI